MFSLINCFSRTLSKISSRSKPSLYTASQMSSAIWGYRKDNDKWKLFDNRFYYTDRKVLENKFWPKSSRTLAEANTCHSEGPSSWEKLLDIKVGKRQSPIDIVQAKATFDGALKNLKFSYPNFDKAQLQNNGHTIVFSPREEGNTSAVSSGPVSNQYKLAQFHFHWGEHNDIGSEHTVDSKPYAAELHLVHYNTDLYGSVGEALTAKDGLTVLGIFLKVGDKEHSGLKNITDIITGIRDSGSSVTLEKPFNPQCLFPDSLDYWTYPGSLTTPPLSESVTWVVFKEPIMVSSAQIAAFREIKSTDGHCVCENFRPTCDLHERVVRASFEYKQ